MKRHSALIVTLLCGITLGGCTKPIHTDNNLANLDKTVTSSVTTTAVTAQPVTTLSTTLTTTLPPTETTTTALPSTTTAPSTTPPTSPAIMPDGVFVRVTDYIPDIAVELKYATADNITGQPIYGFTDVYLRYGTVKKLISVQETLREQGLSLKIWDGFRPVSAQFDLWEAFPNAAYVANPNNGYSSHSRGNTVDVTLVTADGTDVEMPTGFDDFSALADRDYSDCSEISRQNAALLESVMTDSGFDAYYAEWWHFSDTVDYPVETVFAP